MYILKITRIQNFKQQQTGKNQPKFGSGFPIRFTNEFVQLITKKITCIMNLKKIEQKIGPLVCQHA